MPENEAMVASRTKWVAQWKAKSADVLGVAYMFTKMCLRLSQRAPPIEVRRSSDGSTHWDPVVSETLHLK